MKTEIISPKINFRKIVLFFCGVIGLVGTWFFLWILLAAATEGWLVPWDTVPGRPPLGTIARTINDFFEIAPGAVLPSTFFVLVSLVVFLLRFTRSDNKVSLLFFFAASNFVFGVLVILLASFSLQLPNLWLSQPRPRFDTGFHQTWPAIVITVILVMFLFALQLRWNLSSESESSNVSEL